MKNALLTSLRERWSALQTERSSFIPHWQEITDYALPRAGRYFSHDRNRGENRYGEILDNTATHAIRILSAGMMAGATSPARPWFRLAAPDPDLNDLDIVREWLEDVQKLMQRVFMRSNTYRALPHYYTELATFGTAAGLILSDNETVIWHYPLTAGQYAISTNDKGIVDTLYREFDMTVAQMVKRFGYNRCSNTVKSDFDSGRLDTWHTVVHAIEPRQDRDVRMRDSLNMPWRSVYFEEGDSADSVLSEGGYLRFPAVCPRWSVSGGDIYGDSPAMESLGDIKQLQHEQLRKANAIDYQSLPPLQVPSDLAGDEVDYTPGGVTPTSTAGQQAGIRPLFEARADISHLRDDIEDVRVRINRTFYADLFLMLHQQDKTMTATEVAERHSEKLLMLGPVLESVHKELLAPMVTLTFEHMQEAGMLPPPPEPLQNVDLEVEFISMLAQAQQAVGANSVDRWLTSVAGIAQLDPNVVDNVDGDKVAAEYADMLGVSPAFVRSPQEVEEIRMSRAQAQAQAAQAELAQSLSQTARNAAQAQQAAPMEPTDPYSGI